MDLFERAATVRLRSAHGRYLFAGDDAISVSQSREGVKTNAKWKVEFVPGGRRIRLRSCHDTYLTATESPFLLGVTGKKVLQTVPSQLDSSVEWEPIKDGYRVTLRTDNARYLRANFGLPPWRNSVTHDIPERTATQDWVLWEVEVTEILVPPSPSNSSSNRSESVSSKHFAYSDNGVEDKR